MRFQIAGNANRNPIYFSTDKKKPSASESEGAGALFSPSTPSSFRTSLLLRERERWCLCLSAAICTRCVGRLCHGLVYKSLHDDRPICDTRNPILPSWLRLRSTIHVVPTTWNRNCVNERWRYGNDSVLWGFMSVLRSLSIFFWVERVCYWWGGFFFFSFFNRQIASFAYDSR